MPALRPRSVLAVAVLALALGLGGCGRKGKLEPPPGQDYVTDSQGKQRDPGPVKPKRHLSLDFLLN